MQLLPAGTGTEAGSNSPGPAAVDILVSCECASWQHTTRPNIKIVVQTVAGEEYREVFNMAISLRVRGLAADLRQASFSEPDNFRCWRGHSAGSASTHTCADPERVCPERSERATFKRLAGHRRIGDARIASALTIFPGKQSKILPIEIYLSSNENAISQPSPVTSLR